MKRSVFVGLLILFLGCMGCATQRQSITAQDDLNDARTTMRIARVMGSDPVASPEYQEAVTNYSVAKAFAKSGRSKKEMQTASEKARLATRHAESAINQEQAIKEQALTAEFDALRNDIQMLRSDFSSLKMDFAELKNQSRMAPFQSARPLPGREVPAPLPPQDQGEKVVREIQFKFLSESEEEVIFLLGSPLIPKTFLIRDAHPRLVCDFMGARPGSKVPLKIRVDGDLIKRIRTWHHKTPQPKLRIVVDLNKQVKYTTRRQMIGGTNILVIRLQPR